MDKYDVNISLALGTLLFAAFAVALIFYFIIAKQKQVHYHSERLQMQHQYETQLLQSRLETQEQSFQYFSEEIHDNVGQVLSVVGMHLYQLQAECKGEREQQLLLQGSELLNKAIDDLRVISHTLNAHYVTKAGLVESLHQEITYINSVKGAKSRLEIEGEPEELSPDRQTLLYRILQEATGNALKHARAKNIVIGLSFRPGMLTASVTDDGEGFDAELTNAIHTGLGLTNMSVRAGLLGGTLLVQSELGLGTSLRLTIATHPN